MTTEGLYERLQKIHEEWEMDKRADELAERRSRRPSHTPVPDGAAIWFFMDETQIIFRDQAALDEYVAGAILEHSRYHGGGVDECSSDPASPCARTRILPPTKTDAEQLARAVRDA